MRLLSLLGGVGLILYSAYLTFTGVEYGGAFLEYGALPSQLTYVFPAILFVLGIVLIALFFLQTISEIVIRTVFLIAMAIVIGWLVWSVYNGDTTVINILRGVGQ